MKSAILTLFLMFTTVIPFASAQRIEPRKRLIEFGWDEPDTTFLVEQQQQIERSPFDGCVFHVNSSGSPTRPPRSLAWEAWGNFPFDEKDLLKARDELRRGAASARRPMSHFLRFNTTPGKLDWFDDFSAVLSNARLAASLAKAGKCAGILFDTEQYEGQLFDYQQQRNASTRSWDEYARQANRRGFELMEAFQSEFPDLQVLLTFGHSYPWDQQQRAGKATTLSKVRAGLLVPFLDGMISAARGKAKIIDGYELAYALKDRASFRNAREIIKSKVRSIVSEPLKYDQIVSAGFGIWLDNDWRAHGWNETDTSKNYFSPAAFEASVGFALEQSDEYVWIYTEQPRWWSQEGKPLKLPNAYREALAKQRR